MIHTMQMQVVGRDIQMAMDLDPDNVCDVGIRNCIQVGKPIEEEVCHVLARVLQPGDCAVDGGANVGFLTILMSKLVGETGHVYAFEPGGNNLPKLAANIALNKCQNVSVIDKPLSDTTAGIAKFYEHDHPGYNSLWPDLSKTIMATRTTAFTTLEKELLGRPIPVLIKLDIEGAELSALKGSGTLLRWQPPVIIAELNAAALERAGATIEELREYLQQNHYDAFALYEDGNLPCFIPRETRIVTSKLNANVMFSTIEKVQSLWPEVLI